MQGRHWDEFWLEHTGKIIEQMKYIYSCTNSFVQNLGGRYTNQIPSKSTEQDNDKILNNRILNNFEF